MLFLGFAPAGSKKKGGKIPPFLKIDLTSYLKSALSAFSMLTFANLDAI
jgi:hypothetical protein